MRQYAFYCCLVCCSPGSAVVCLVLRDISTKYFSQLKTIGTTISGFFATQLGRGHTLCHMPHNLLGPLYHTSKYIYRDQRLYIPIHTHTYTYYLYICSGNFIQEVQAFLRRQHKIRSSNYCPGRPPHASLLIIVLRPSGQTSANT